MIIKTASLIERDYRQMSPELFREAMINETAFSYWWRQSPWAGKRGNMYMAKIRTFEDGFLVVSGRIQQNHHITDQGRQLSNSFILPEGMQLTAEERDRLSSICSQMLNASIFIFNDEARCDARASAVLLGH